MEPVRQSSLKQITQAYSQTPWRKQLQVIASFLLVIVSIAIVAGIYLSVTSQAATLGRQIQDMQIRMDGSQRLDLLADDGTSEESNINLVDVVPIEELYIEIADLQGQVAMNMSSATMRPKAEAMGFISSVPETTDYVDVPGYQGRQRLQLAPPPAPEVVETNVLASAYRESLIDWLDHQITLFTRSWLDEVKR
jgi:hypothetical protein